MGIARTCDVLMKNLKEYYGDGEKKIERKEILVMGSSQKVAWLEQCYHTNLQHPHSSLLFGSSFGFVPIRYSRLQSRN
ncbi:hypothetical protein HanRHA438_Chr15g0724931 [Helianthus annuus]|nr:hypothetical protein HanIR_Chr15g0775511 [Helianthus annuus]KAJ0846445.1 hypothetical protein HanRHA438_Chr15g0724931 [Helianthus annuus]